MKKIIITAMRAAFFAALLATVTTIHAKTLEAVRIEGLFHSSVSSVEGALQFSVGNAVTPVAVQETIRRIYALGHYRNVDIYVDGETDETVSLVIKLEEFPLLELIEFEGNRKIRTRELEEAKILTLYQPISDAQLFEARQKILSMYEDKGYLLATVDARSINTMAGGAIVKFVIEEGPRMRIRTINFEGHESVSNRWMHRRLKTRENRWWRSGNFNEELYRAHLDTLILQFNDLGFLDAEVVRDSVWFSQDGRDVFIDITVHEGRRYVAGDIAVTGNTVITTDALLRRVVLMPGRPFRISQFEMTKFLIETAYREEGYLWVRVEDTRSFRGENSDTVDVLFNITEGRPAIVRRVDIRGNTKTWEKVIRREISLMPGQRYRQSRMMASQQNIMRLNYFTSVMPDISPNEDGTIDLIFDIVERDNIGMLSLGAAYSDQDKLTGTFSTAIPNLRGSGQELRLEVQYGNWRRSGMVSFTEPWAFDMPLWLTGTVFADQQIYDRYDWVENRNVPNDTVTSYGFRVGVGRSRLPAPFERFRFQTVYQLSHERMNREDFVLGGNFRLVETGTMSRLRLTVERYDLDMPLFPNEGTRLTIVPEVAGLGGDFQYFKGRLTYENYFRLPGKFVFGSEMSLGIITEGLGGELRISANDLFTGGGAYGNAIIRGYPDWAFGGGGRRGRPAGDGISMFAVNLSLRYPLIDQQIYVGFFADMGNTWPEISGIDLSDLYRGIGGGLRMNLPMIGVMGVDVGYGLDPINRRNFNEPVSGWNWHIIMNRGF